MPLTARLFELRGTFHLYCPNLVSIEHAFVGFLSDPPSISYVGPKTISVLVTSVDSFASLANHRFFLIDGVFLELLPAYLRSLPLLQQHRKRAVCSLVLGSSELVSSGVIGNGIGDFIILFRPSLSFCEKRTFASCEPIASFLVGTNVVGVSNLDGVERDFVPVSGSEEELSVGEVMPPTPASSCRSTTDGGVPQKFASSSVSRHSRSRHRCRRNKSRRFKALSLAVEHLGKEDVRVTELDVQEHLITKQGEVDLVLPSVSQSIVSVWSSSNLRIIGSPSATLLGEYAQVRIGQALDSNVDCYQSGSVEDYRS